MQPLPLVSYANTFQTHQFDMHGNQVVVNVLFARLWDNLCAHLLFACEYHAAMLFKLDVA